MSKIVIVTLRYNSNKYVDLEECRYLGCDTV
jgi:hypothetical protein